MGNKLTCIDIDAYKSDIYSLRSETAYISSCLDDRIDAVSDRFETVMDRIKECEQRIDELFHLLGPVLDAQADRPKHKWLWEIFEPNDIGIDFSYKM